MTVETFNPNKVVNKTTTLETPVKVLSDNKPSQQSNGSRIGFVSLGCPKNLVDSERILTQLRTEGYDVVPTYNDADLVIVNTCGFIDAAVEESLDTIGEALKENGKVIVTGCLGVKEDEIRELHPNVLAITGPHAYETVVEQVHDHLPKPQHNPFEDLIPDHGVKLTPRHYAYLKISEGCNHRCTFCIIPSMRGDLVSRPVGNVLDEAKRLKDAGVKELLVISQDTSAYGVDVKHRTGFWNGMPVKAHMQQLCEKLGEMGIWVRLHYVYPYPHVDDLIPLMNEGKILPYLDIPFQHANKRILKLMKRPGSAERVLERVKKWREQCPSLVIRSTFIVGFPGAVLYQHPGRNDNRPKLCIAVVPGLGRFGRYVTNLPLLHPLGKPLFIVRSQFRGHIQQIEIRGHANHLPSRKVGLQFMPVNTGGFQIELCFQLIPGRERRHQGASNTEKDRYRLTESSAAKPPAVQNSGPGQWFNRAFPRFPESGPRVSSGRRASE